MSTLKNLQLFGSIEDNQNCDNQHDFIKITCPCIFSWRFEFYKSFVIVLIDWYCREALVTSLPH